MKTKTGSIIAIIILSLLACGLIFATYIGIKYIPLSSFPGISFGLTSQRLALDKEFKLEDAKTINVRTDASDIKFLKATEDNDGVNVKIFASEDRVVRAEKDNEKLDVTVEGSCQGFCLGFNSSRVEITLPEEYEGNIIIHTSTGDIESANFSRASYEIDVDAGDIDIPAAKNLKVVSNVGDLVLGTIENITIETNVGDIKINECYNELHIKTRTGDVDINELQLSKNSDIKGEIGDITIRNTGNVFIDAHTNIGDTKIRNNTKSDIELKIETHTGDIETD